MRLIILFLVLNSFIYSQEQTITGKVLDANTNTPLSKANILIEDKEGIGTSSGGNGEFNLSGNISEGDVLIVSYIGYDTREIQLSSADFANDLIIELEPKIIPGQTVLVEASLGKEGITPLTFQKIKREEIEESYSVQDIPEFLSFLPSTTFYSDNGNGIGYNYLSIRGFDQRRISVSINGIPQNDPEDHNVYWLDFPDLLASTEIIQVQRGAGSGAFGYPAIGGSINILTALPNVPGFNASASIGSYNTRKYSVSLSSGLLGDKYSVYAKLSQLLSSGYRNSSWVKFNSYHISAVRYDNKLTTQLNLFGGPIEDGLAYYGLPKFAVKDKELRRANYSDWGADIQADTFTYVVPRRSVELENFSQPHFELLNEYKINKDITLNSALFLVIGEGFFDYDAYWHIYYDDYFRFKDGGYDITFVPENPLIRATVENTQYGWIPKVSMKHKNGELIIGGELRLHRSDHWGRIQYANNLPPGYELNRYYYFYNGRKDIISGFVHESYNLNEKINLLGELQVAYHKYRLHNELYVGTDFSLSDIFFNPRAGINYKIDPSMNVYLSFARVTREPRLKNYYDAAESSAGEIPQFEADTTSGTTIFNFDNPLVKPETMNDFELGASFNNDNLSFSLNLFYMLFNDEIAANGQVDRFGQPITGNVDKTIHQGIELSAIAKLFTNLEIFGNATLSKNSIEEGNAFIEYYVTEDSTAVSKLSLNGNRLSGFPDFLANFGFSFKKDGIFLRFIGKYVGEFFSDNHDENLSQYLLTYPGFVDYDGNKNEAYFSANFYGSYELNLFESHTPTKIFLQVNNIFDNLYSAYAIGKEFFPAAERNFLVGLQLGL